MRKMREKDPEEAYRKITEWKNNNKDKVRCHDAKKCARRRTQTLTGKITGDEWTLIKEKQNGKCKYCGKKANLTIDHVVPLISGGEHNAGNIVGACLSCNSRKSKMSVEEFAKRQGRLCF